MFRIAHISDLHIPPLPRMHVSQLFGKRLLGLFSWHKKWKREHLSEVLHALADELRRLEPDHICITGDLTFTTHPEEVDAAAQWLSTLGDPQSISVVPGNHDAYAYGALQYALERWDPWMQDDSGNTGFPYLQRRGPVDIIGVCSAVPTLPGLTLGRMGKSQLQRVAKLLDTLETPRRLRLLLVHHPPQDGATDRRRALADRKKLQELLEVRAVDLILHGHLHRPVRSRLRGPTGPVPVLGAASGSTIGQRYTPAHFHLLQAETHGEISQISVQNAHYCPPEKRFILGPEEPLIPADPYFSRSAADATGAGC